MKQQATSSALVFSAWPRTRLKGAESGVIFLLQPKRLHVLFGPKPIGEALWRTLVC